MRIRKHLKISAELSNASGSSLYSQSLIQCQLNQSPWDIITFPPDSNSSRSHPPFQVDGDDSLNANGSLGDSIGAVESVASMKMSLGDEDEHEEEEGDGRHVETVKREKQKEEEISCEKSNDNNLYCCKTDGKGWHCRNEATEGHSMCEHHINQLRDYNPLAHPSPSTANKTPAAAAATTATHRRGRPKKPSAASNPYEFYYYSGFGPRWGKKRGTRTESTGNRTGDFVTETDSVLEPATPCYWSSAQIDNAELDYVEDDEEDEDQNEVEGKKRVRKPIKARSLKSLM